MYFFNLSPLDFLLWNCSCLEWLCKGLLLHTCIVDFCSDFLETALISAWPKFFIVERARVYCMILEPHCFLTNVQTEQKWWVFGTLFAALLLWILFSYGIAQANGWLCKGLFFKNTNICLVITLLYPLGFLSCEIAINWLCLEPHCFLTLVHAEQKGWVFRTLFTALLLWILLSYGIAQADGWLCKGLSSISANIC